MNKQTNKKINIWLFFSKNAEKHEQKELSELWDKLNMGRSDNAVFQR